MKTHDIHISEIQLDALKEIINISAGKAMAKLNSMISKHLTLSTPDIQIVKADNLNHVFKNMENDTISEVKMPFFGAISGYGKLIFSSADASKMVHAFTAGDIEEEEYDEIRSGTLSEIGNIMLNSLMGSISNLFTTAFGFKVPVYSEGALKDLFNFDNPDENSAYIIAFAKFRIEELEIKGEMLISMELNSFDQLLKFIESFSNNYGA